ncbi:uncharacterized protein K452DRAFT_292450 [Aplosporella prunicola CBS 121167]|uniref:Extracellular membrane protein CFEM domain-containing protein n=1 Tax=Aplosporella prunicola CBS 121167 TaxID=1176127 RepID=A0A6A6AWI4_9PEZI|nr:uncharacterized protein K452DRAFT_292450 [Aplosporella prunicola CBS 121167]KAF2136362.1 hypothetical protein K452DRAFT_292450 [Aplosporella prunicola CBS 121167]
MAFLLWFSHITITHTLHIKMRLSHLVLATVVVAASPAVARPPWDERGPDLNRLHWCVRYCMDDTAETYRIRTKSRNQFCWKDTERVRTWMYNELGHCIEKECPAKADLKEAKKSIWKFIWDYGGQTI